MHLYSYEKIKKGVFLLWEKRGINNTGWPTLLPLMLLSQKVAILFHPIHKSLMCVTLPSAQAFPMKWKIGNRVSLVGQQVRVVSAIPVDTERKGFKHISLFLSTCLSTSIFLYPVRPYDRISPLDLWPMTHSADIWHNSNPTCMILFMMQSCMISACWYRCTKT